MVDSEYETVDDKSKEQNNFNDYNKFLTAVKRKSSRVSESDSSLKLNNSKKVKNKKE